MRTHLFIITFLVTLLSLPAWANIAQVPGVISAPVLLYDDGSNLLEDGEYGLTVTFSDSLGTLLFTEEHLVQVRNGVALISLGNGYAVGSNYSTPSGGLDVTVFNVDTDVVVEILVEGQSNPQELTILGSQPYSFIAQKAVSVVDDAITSSSIKDGSIHEEDLDESLIEKLSSGSSVVVSSEDGAGTVELDSSQIKVRSTIGLNNASGGNVEKVLQGLDDSIDLLRGTNIESVTGDLSSHISSSSGVHGVTGSVVGTTNSQTLKNKSIDSSNSIVGEAITSGTISDSRIPSSITRDSELSALETKVNQNTADLLSYNISLSTNQGDINNLENRVEDLESYKAIAFGKMYDTGSGSGHTMWCEGGKNINQKQNTSARYGHCEFGTATSSDDYMVVWSTQTAGCTTGFSMTCQIYDKTTTQFSYDCFCMGTYLATVGNFEASFVVYE